MCCLSLGEKTADIAGMGVCRKWTSATGSGERPAGLVGRGYPARSWCLREGCRTCAWCDRPLVSLALLIKPGYTGVTWHPESKKPNPEDWAKCLNLLVPTAGFELAT